jgi:DNA replication protein DnaC
MMMPTAQISAERINQVLETKPEIEEGAKNTADEKGTVEFKNVSFRYPESAQNELTDVSFKVNKGETLAIIGATGSGKTYLACALGMAAVRRFLTVKYVRLPELLTELAIARSNGAYRKVIQQYKKPALLILDEWLLYPLKETEARDLLEIAETRYKKASTIFCSQFDVPGWRDKIGDPILADAICDRIVHDSYSIVIDCKESMRKRKGVQESDA